jgi:hypothetical protein
MHLNFAFTTVQILWTLTFAAQLVLLVVLLGRDRVRRFPWFTASIVLVALRLLTTRLLYGRLAPITLSALFILLADLAVAVGLVVIAELAWRAFHDTERRTKIIGASAMVVVAGGVLAAWGPWPAWKTVAVDSVLGILRLMQLVAQKGDLLVSLLAVELGLLVILFGRRYKAGWRSHTQQIVIGLSTAAISQLTVQAVWQTIAMRAVPQTQAEYERILGLRDKLFNANSAVYVAVLVWWIVFLWMDEPGTKDKADTESTKPEPVYLEAPVVPATEETPTETVDAVMEDEDKSQS